MMELTRAIEILDPEHREQYDSLEEVNEACRMGMEALKAQLAEGDELEDARREMAIYEEAVEKYGKIAQIDQAIEEMGELIVALNKFKRHLRFAYGDYEEIMAAVQEERADVEIMLYQLHVIFGDCSDWECYKLEQLKASLAKDTRW